MTYAKIYTAYPVIENLKQYRYDSITADRLFKLQRELKEVYLFMTEEHKKLFDRFKPEYDKKSGTLHFQSEQDMEEFVKSMDELDKLEHEIQARKPRIALSSEITMTPNEREALEDLIEFYEEEEAEVKIEATDTVPEDAEGIELKPAE